MKKGLISKFQERLEISREEATLRISAIFLIFLFFWVIVFFFIYTLPLNQKREADRIVLKEAKYQSVSEISERGIFLEEDQFNKLISLKDTVFVSFLGEDRGKIIFLVKKNGFSFLQKKDVKKILFYSKDRIIVQDNSIVVAVERDWPCLILGFLFFVFALFVFLNAGWSLQIREDEDTYRVYSVW